MYAGVDALLPVEGTMNCCWRLTRLGEGLPDLLPVNPIRSVAVCHSSSVEWNTPTTLL